MTTHLALLSTSRPTTLTSQRAQTVESKKEAVQDLEQRFGVFSNVPDAELESELGRPMVESINAFFINADTAPNIFVENLSVQKLILSIMFFLRNFFYWTFYGKVNFR